jgi:hypothetical protein
MDGGCVERSLLTLHAITAHLSSPMGRDNKTLMVGNALTVRLIRRQRFRAEPDWRLANRGSLPEFYPIILSILSLIYSTILLTTITVADGFESAAYPDPSYRSR